MPLTGELEHLPIVDVIQLIHSTRKSGTLNVYSRKGEGQLVFNNGYIISATHSSEKLKIGKILLESHIISQADLDKALALQEQTVEDRKPLIVTLLEHCGLSKDAAYKALETLIEMTVVEMICWTRGIFTLDIDEINVSDDYRFLPKQLQAVTLDTQMVLMDALRIFDEKVHSGEIQISDEPLVENPLEQFVEEEEEPQVEDNNDEEIVVSEDLLGLADLDKLERKKPYVFKGLEAFDPADIHRQLITKTLVEIPDEDKENLVAFLSSISTSHLLEDGATATTTKSQAVIIYTCDEFIQHTIMTVCKKEGILVFATADRSELDNLIDRALFKYLEPILVFGGPVPQTEGFSKAEIINVRSLKMAQYPHISIIQLASPLDFTFSLQSLNEGVRAVFPTPYFCERKETFTADMIHFLNTFQSYIRGCFNEERRQQFAKLRNSLSGLRLLRKAPDISLMVLQFVSELFERSLTLIVDKKDLIAERSVGIVAPKDFGPAAPMKFRIPIRKESLFLDIINSGDSFFGKPEDGTFEDLIYPEIGAPKDSTILLLPLKSNDRTITITYADFGSRAASKVSLDFLEFFVGQAGIAMENALFRKQIDSSNQPEIIR
ncbi:protein of unknown function [Desulfuromusa kysingii]|uniref:PatA-like N-terminal domain-containing protein n=1 Tax=Desulfuromusa kysingii TaxID=37625 RepID=A0A1H4DNR5_9BACT|nr:DUF4388 domain-containing protein [Desulfuromusa kysingii]SEA74237.1 protein of unknown function [Desulfuromusa kysingii]